MTTRYISRLAAVAMLALAATSCSDFDTEAPAFTVPVATMQPNATILDVKTRFWDDATNYITTIPRNEDGSHIIVKGRVISNDRAGNVYKSLWIQDETAGLPLSINRSGLYQQYRTGQEIVVDLTDMYLGKYNGLQQLGFPEWYAQGNAWEATFMPFEFFTQHSQLNGLPDPSATDIVTVNNFDQLTTESLAYWQGRLVRLRNVHFDDGGKLAFTDGYKINTNRTLRDSQNGSITVRTSGYANFRNTILPEGNFDLICLLGYYGTDWQVVINSLDDFQGVTFEKGTEADPYTIAEVAEIENAEGYEGNKDGWTEGYIVGCVAPEVQSITSEADILWDGSDYLGTTLVIAPTPDTRDISQVLVFTLPAGSKLQTYGNLMSNPDNLGKAMKVRGRLNKVLDVTGMTNITGDVDSFWIEGLDIPVVKPDGTEDNPYTVADVITFNPQSTDTPAGDDQKNVWVSGYIVGYYADYTAVFSADATVNTNILLGDTPDVTSKGKAICVQLPYGDIRTAVNLQDHKDNFGKKLMIRGDILKYNTMPGVKNPTAYTLDGQGGGGDTPTPPQPSGTLTFVKTNTIVSGKQYILVNDEGKVATPIQQNYSYGYLYVEDPVSVTDGKITTSAANAITIATSGSGYTLVDSYGRYLSMDDNDAHKSFQLYTSPEAGSVWNGSVASDGTVTLTNSLRSGFTVRYVANFKNFSPSTTSSDPLPHLYVIDDGSAPDVPPTPPTPPTPTEKEGDGTEDNPYTVTDVIAFDPQSTTAVAGDDQKQVWVTGYIVGYYNSFTYYFTADGAVNTNILISATTEGQEGKCANVQLPIGDVRTSLNLKENPGNLGKKIKVRGDILKYNSMPGVRNTKACVIL